MRDSSYSVSRPFIPPPVGLASQGTASSSPAAFLLHPNGIFARVTITQRLGMAVAFRAQIGNPFGSGPGYGG